LNLMDLPVSMKRGSTVEFSYNHNLLSEMSILFVLRAGEVVAAAGESRD